MGRVVSEGVLNCHETIASTPATGALNIISTETVNSVGVGDLRVLVNKYLEKQATFCFPGLSLQAGYEEES